MHQNSLRSTAYPKALPKLYKGICILSSESSVHCQTIHSSYNNPANLSSPLFSYIYNMFTQLHNFADIATVL
jgi:hypothetical protein